MEAILNLVWLAITVMAIWLWRCRWIVSRPDPRHSPRLEAVAMVCALALLFPVISLTDDLHPEIVAVDVVSGKRNACLSLATAPDVRTGSVVSSAHSVYGILPVRIALVQFVFWHFSPVAELRQERSLTNVPLGRSPPDLL